MSPTKDTANAADPEPGDSPSAGFTRWYTISLQHYPATREVLDILDSEGPMAAIQHLLRGLDAEVTPAQAESAGQTYDALPQHGPVDDIHIASDYVLITDLVTGTMHLLREYEPTTPASPAPGVPAPSPAVTSTSTTDESITAEAPPGLQTIAGPVWELLRQLGVHSGQMLTLWSEGAALTGVSNPAAYASPGGYANWVAPIPPPDGPQHVALHEYGPTDPTWYDLVLAALPWSDVRIPGPDLRNDLTKLHAEILQHALRRVTPGGVLVAIASHQVLDDPAEHDKRALAALGDLIGAARLPDNALHANGTNPVDGFPRARLAPSDLLVFRRRPAGAPDRSAPFVMTRRQAVHAGQDGSILVSEYFKHHPHHVIGSPGPGDHDWATAPDGPARSGRSPARRPAGRARRHRPPRPRPRRHRAGPAARRLRTGDLQDTTIPDLVTEPDRPAGSRPLPDGAPVQGL